MIVYRVALTRNALRYCIECDDPRFWSEAETQFLEFFRNSPVPIVFVLTKFDVVVSQCVLTRLKNGGRDMVNWTSIETLAVGDAKERIKENICRPLEQTVGGGVKAEIISKEGTDYSLFNVNKKHANLGLRSKFGEEACRRNNEGSEAEFKAPLDRRSTCYCR
jgi:hypothetical protein